MTSGKKTNTAEILRLYLRDRYTKNPYSSKIPLDFCNYN